MKWIPITRECPKPEKFRGRRAESREVLIWDGLRVTVGKAFFYGKENHPFLDTPPCYVFSGLYMSGCCCRDEDNEDFHLREGTHWAELEGPTETTP